jgi:hypothetical protein
MGDVGAEVFTFHGFVQFKKKVTLPVHIVNEGPWNSMVHQSKKTDVFERIAHVVHESLAVLCILRTPQAEIHGGDGTRHAGINP